MARSGSQPQSLDPLWGLGGAAALARPAIAANAAVPEPAALGSGASALRARRRRPSRTCRSAWSRAQDTARSLVEKYMARIEAIDGRDGNGPALRSVLELNPTRSRSPKRLDAERKAGKVRGPLHGIPVLVKDNIGSADRMQTTAGSLALLGAPPSADAHVVKRLREAGAVLLGKTNLSEWANFRSTHSSSGWSGRGGQCRNPYALDRNPSGSSSGSGRGGVGESVRGGGRVPRPTARSSRRPTTAASSASSRRSGSSAAPASSRSRTRRTRRGRCAAP